MTAYTPTTEEVRAAWIDAHRVDTPLGGRMDMEARPRERIREFDRWMASILAEQGEPGWEYGTALRTPRGELWDEEREASRESAEGHVLSCSAGLHEGNHEPDKCVLVRRTRGVAAGPWVPVEENTPNRTIGLEER